MERLRKALLPTTLMLLVAAQAGSLWLLWQTKEQVDDIEYAVDDTASARSTPEWASRIEGDAEEAARYAERAARASESLCNRVGGPYGC